MRLAPVMHVLEHLHRQLSDLNADRLAPAFAEDRDWREQVELDRARSVLEGEVLDAERAQIAARAATAPTDPTAFVAWFEDLEHSGPGQNDPLFNWLATRSSAAQMRWFLHQETAGEAGFEDLVALTQVRMEARPKLELARNYWDEMGRGHAGGMHGPMLARLGEALHLDELRDVPIVWESLALANVMVGLAANRRFAYQSLGALGVIELTAPWRAARVDAGLVRLELAPRARHYFALHATLDVKHSAAWNKEVLLPVVTAEPRAARAIAEGALLRLEAGRRCFERYRRELGLSGTQPSFASVDQPLARSESPMSMR